ncbi:MAG: two-component system response regulator CreB [Nitrospirae bacterium GWC2_42_7]|nr:MAG: two-component system response regulator CreB [Nitrospirae bacterium GWC2_42_7]
MAKKILVVEDEISIADNITYALSTEGFESIYCATGKEALEIIKNKDIAIAIVDIGLPDINGFDLVRQIRKNSSVPIIFVTARSDEIDRIVGLEIGADDYITKPFSPRELTARVRAVLRRTSNEMNKSAESGNVPHTHFQLDEKRLVISYHGKPLDLSRYEFKLLSVFVRNPGRVYSREQLMSLVWEEPEMSLDRTVDTHIKTIRQKLKSIRPAEEPIVTHRGLGYSLKESS